jgi:putative transcription factor
LRCEVCGRKIFGKPFRVVIEGAKLTVCTECSKHGKVIWEEEPKPSVQTAKPRTAVYPVVIQRKSVETPADTTLELVENYDAEIRKAREKLGLTHEQLGKRINEKVSLLRKIETGKMKPNNALATRLEHTLKIKLIVPESEEKVKIPPTRIAKAGSEGVTLGDLLRIDKKEEAKEDKPARKQS